MAHDKVYGICENKCKVEVLAKSQAFGITETIIDNEDKTTFQFNLPESGQRRIFAGVIKNPICVIPDNMSFANNYYSEIIIRHNSITKHPSNFLNIAGVKYLNNDLDITYFNVLHYYFTFDGFNVCCRCTGYYDDSLPKVE